MNINHITKALEKEGHNIQIINHIYLYIKNDKLAFNRDRIVDVSISRGHLYWIVDDNVTNDYRIAYTRHRKVSRVIDEVYKRLIRKS